MKNNSSPASLPTNPPKPLRAMLFFRFRAWLPFGAALLAIAGVTGLGFRLVVSISGQLQACPPAQCNPWTTGVLPLCTVFMLWLLMITGIMAYIVKVKPWR